MKWWRLLDIVMAAVNLSAGVALIVGVVLELRSPWRSTNSLPPSSSEPEPAKDSLPA